MRGIWILMKMVATYEHLSCFLRDDRLIFCFHSTTIVTENVHRSNLLSTTYLQWKKNTFLQWIFLFTNILFVLFFPIEIQAMPVVTIDYCTCKKLRRKLITTVHIHDFRNKNMIDESVNIFIWIKFILCEVKEVFEVKSFIFFHRLELRTLTP